MDHYGSNTFVNTFVFKYNNYQNVFLIVQESYPLCHALMWLDLNVFQFQVKENSTQNDQRKKENVLAALNDRPRSRADLSQGWIKMEYLHLSLAVKSFTLFFLSIPSLSTSRLY